MAKLILYRQDIHTWILTASHGKTITIFKIIDQYDAEIACRNFMTSFQFPYDLEVINGD
jgi:hypothetical protein